MGIYLYDWDYKELKSIFDKANETQIGWFTEIKEPHGRLIDEAEIRIVMDKLCKYQRPIYSDIAKAVREMTTVIEAEVK